MVFIASFRHQVCIFSTVIYFPAVIRNMLVGWSNFPRNHWLFEQTHNSTALHCTLTVSVIQPTLLYVFHDRIAVQIIILCKYASASNVQYSLPPSVWKKGPPKNTLSYFTGPMQCVRTAFASLLWFYFKPPRGAVIGLSSDGPFKVCLFTQRASVVTRMSEMNDTTRGSMLSGSPFLSLAWVDTNCILLH